MAWKKPTEELNALHSKLVRPFVCVEKKMFGFQVFFVNDNMFTGVFEDGIMMHLSPGDRDAMLAECKDSVPFTPMGREMKGYVFVPGKLLEEPEHYHEVEGWVARSYAFVSSLPPKEKKPKAKK